MEGDGVTQVESRGVRTKEDLCVTVSQKLKTCGPEGTLVSKDLDCDVRRH